MLQELFAGVHVVVNALLLDLVRAEPRLHAFGPIFLAALVGVGVGPQPFVSRLPEQRVQFGIEGRVDHGDHQHVQCVRELVHENALSRIGVTGRAQEVLFANSSERQR